MTVAPALMVSDAGCVRPSAGLAVLTQVSRLLPEHGGPGGQHERAGRGEGHLGAAPPPLTPEQAVDVQLVFLTPTRETWDEGHTRAQCIVTPSAGAPLLVGRIGG